MTPSDFELLEAAPELDIIALDRALFEKAGNEPIVPHRNQYQAIIWIKEGSGTHLIDDDLISVEPTTFMLVPRGQIRAFNPGKETAGMAIRFSDSFPQLLGLS